MLLVKHNKINPGVETECDNIIRRTGEIDKAPVCYCLYQQPSCDIGYASGKKDKSNQPYDQIPGMKSKERQDSDNR
jgi:hypothetical protein